MKPRSDASVAIVGAGIAGLSAGYELARAGLRPVIFEKESFVGGRMSSEQVEGFILEKAAYTFPEFHKNLTALLRELGMAGSLMETPATSSTFADGKEYQIKIGSPVDFLKYKLLSLKNKKDLIKIFLHAQSLGKALKLAQPTEKTFELERESAAEYILRHYNEDILEYIAYPIFCEIFLGTPEGNSNAAFLATINNLTSFKIFAFDRGMSMLPERMAHDLDVRLNCPVLGLTRGKQQRGYEVRVGGANPQTCSFDALIFAVPTPIVAQVFDDLPRTLKNDFEQVRYAPSIVATLALDKRYPNTSMISNLVRKDYKTLGTVVFDHHKSPTHVPKGKELVTAILCEDASRRLFREPDEKIMREVLVELDRLFPRMSEKLLFSRFYRWEHGAVQLQPGFLFKQHSMRQALEHQAENFFCAGDGLYKSSLEVSFMSGISAARQLIKKLTSSG